MRWMPDEWTRAMRRRLARRSQLVRARTRAKNEIHARLPRRVQAGAGGLLRPGQRGRQHDRTRSRCSMRRSRSSEAGRGA
jgi:hypothetical protein